ncbi:MAG TPA: VOC family protein [Bacteroidales bacterium]|nr:VOC family protein [Bacteroidales bacterium]
MKKIAFFALAFASIACLSFYAGRKSAKEPILQNNTVTQVAVIVKDIDKASAAWAKLLGQDIPAASTTENNKDRPTLYKGNPSDAQAKLAFFSMNNLQIELIQPLGQGSTWQEYLDKHGEGIHHIAFQVKNIDGMEQKFLANGNPTVMRGGWDGGAYSYIDATNDLGCILELLENY